MGEYLDILNEALTKLTNSRKNNPTDHPDWEVADEKYGRAGTMKEPFRGVVRRLYRNKKTGGTIEEVPDMGYKLLVHGGPQDGGGPRVYPGKVHDERGGHDFFNYVVKAHDDYVDKVNMDRVEKKLRGVL